MKTKTRTETDMSTWENRAITAGTADTDAGDLGFAAGGYGYVIEIREADFDASAGNLGRTVNAFIRGRGTEDDLLSGSIIFAPTETTAGLVEEIKRDSGLTWEELGRLFGVSRRAVHNWAKGGRANSFNDQRIRRVHSLIHELDWGEGEDAREALLRHREGEPSVYLYLVGEVSSDRPLDGFSPAELLSPGSESE